MDANVTVFFYAGFDDLRDVGIKREMRGDPATVSSRYRLSPVSFLRYQIEKRQHARLFCEKCAAQLIWIFFAGVSHFVEKAFDGEAGVRMAYGTPPLDRHADFWRVQVHLQIRNAVKNVRG